jgi:hypothetical protein
MEGAIDDPKHVNTITTFEDSLTKRNLEEMKDIKASAVDVYIEIKDYKLKTVVKLLSPSAGLFDSICYQFA